MVGGVTGGGRGRGTLTPALAIVAGVREQEEVLGLWSEDGKRREAGGWRVLRAQLRTASWN